MSYELKAFASDTLAVTLAAGATSATLTTGVFGTMTGEQILIIDRANSKREFIKCTIAGTSITGITRAVDGTSDVEHLAGAEVSMSFAPSHYEALQVLLGYAQITTSIGSITTVQDLSGLSVTVSVPTDGKMVKITGYCPVIDASGAGVMSTLYIKEGSTVLNENNLTHYGAAHINSQIVTAIITPTSGTHTYKLSAAASSGNISHTSSATQPSFISVEYI